MASKSTEEYSKLMKREDTEDTVETEEAEDTEDTVETEKAEGTEGTEDTMETEKAKENKQAEESEESDEAEEAEESDESEESLDIGVPVIQVSRIHMQKLREIAMKHLTECGWRNATRSIIENALADQGLETIDYAELAEAIIPEAHNMVPGVIAEKLTQYALSLLKDESSSEDDD